MSTLSLPHPGNIKRATAVLVATAVIIALAVVALISVTVSSGSGTGAPAAPATHHQTVNPSVSATKCMYLDQPC